jgi:hypothetical protein
MYISMVIPILEPVCAGLLVSLINKYVLSGSLMAWFQSSCETEEIRASEREYEVEESSSSTTSITADVEVHVHHVD